MPARTSVRTGPCLPLVVTADPDLLDDLLRLAAAGGTEVDVAPDPAAARARFGAAPLVVIGADQAAACLRARLPRRPRVLIVGHATTVEAAWKIAGSLGAEHVAELPTAEPWVIDRFAERAGPSSTGRLLAVIGGRGGAGASILAGALAVTAVGCGHRTLLIDADPVGGGLDLVLGWEGMDGLRWPALAGTGGRVDPPALLKALPHRGDLVLLSFARDDVLPVPSEAMAATLDAARRGRDVIIADLPRQLDDAATLALAAADQAVLIVPAELRATAAAARIAALVKLHCANVSVVVRGPAPGKLRAREFGVPRTHPAPYDACMTRCIIYTRISKDPTGRRLGVDRQEEACRAQATVLGWDVVGVCEDNDTSATKEKDPRNYARMIKACEAGEADAILVSTVDRLHRQLWKFAPFMRWRKKHGIKFATTEGDNTETSNGRFILNIKASMAEAEWERLSERTRAASRQRAVRGQFHGGAPPFGHQAVTAVVNGVEHTVAIEHHPEHKAWVEEAARRVLAGETVYGICVDWDSKGRTTQAGGRWTHKTLKRILVNPSVTGLREHDGELYPAPWEPIVDRETWESLTALLSDPSRKQSTSNQRRYLLAGLVFCGRCGNRMTSTSMKATSPPAFECSKTKTSHDSACGRMKLVMEPLEAFITEQLFFVYDTDEVNRAAGPADDSDQVQELRQAIAKDQATLKRLADDYDDDKMAEDEYNRRTQRITERLDANQARWSSLRQVSQRAAIAATSNLRQVWAEKDNVWRRTIVAAAIERIDVGPHPRGVSSAPPRRSGEPEEAWRARFDMARADVMAQRVTVTWWS